eukprot:scaffold43222_cov72-Phaeocystis_antarctica.AAC.2
MSRSEASSFCRKPANTCSFLSFRFPRGAQFAPCVRTVTREPLSSLTVTAHEWKMIASGCSRDSKCVANTPCATQDRRSVDASLARAYRAYAGRGHEETASRRGPLRFACGAGYQLQRCMAACKPCRNPSDRRDRPWRCYQHAAAPGAKTRRTASAGGPASRRRCCGASSLPGRGSTGRRAASEGSWAQGTQAGPTHGSGAARVQPFARACRLSARHCSHQLGPRASQSRPCRPTAASLSPTDTLHLTNCCCHGRP